MRRIVIPLLAAAALCGCVSLRAELPAGVVRQLARDDGVELGAVCAHQGQSFSEGASVCMAARRMTCDPSERWVQDGGC